MSKYTVDSCTQYRYTRAVNFWDLLGGRVGDIPRYSIYLHNTTRGLLFTALKSYIFQFWANFVTQTHLFYNVGYFYSPFLFIFIFIIRTSPGRPAVAYSPPSRCGGAKLKKPN